MSKVFADFPHRMPYKTGAQVQAEKVPANYRKEILELNMIDEAKPTVTDTVMEYLSVVWLEYVEPGFDIKCNQCRERILTVYRKMKPILVQMEYDANLLKSIE